MPTEKKTTPKPQTPETQAPESQEVPSPEPKKNGYYRTKENVVVYRTYLPNGTYAQYVAQDEQGRLPEGVKLSEVINDE